jgi:hypothetical protein
MIRRVVLELKSGLRQIQGFVDVEAKDLSANPEGHTLVTIKPTYVLYKETQ